MVETAARSIRTRLLGSWKALAVATLAFSLVATGQAQAAGLIRDAETEKLIRDYAKPIFKAAGLGSQGIEIHIVNDRAFNAFVVDGHNMFIHAGTLMMADTPNQVIGVIAHESGHITGGHLARLRTQVSRAKSAALMLQLLGLAAMAAGAVAGDGNIGQAGAGIAFGGTEAAMRSVLAYRQDEESSADQAAVTFLNASHQSGKGMLQSFEKLATKLIGIEGINPFLQSHPLPTQRLSQLRALVSSSPYYNVKDPPELQFRHDLVRAKLVGFLDKPEVVFNKYPESDRSYPSYYARAIATYRDKGVDAAMPLLDALTESQPDWPYFHEIKGQFLFESGRAKEAIPSLKRAVELSPDEPLIRVMLAQAQLGDPTPQNVDDAITNLQFALARERTSAMGYRQIAIAYGRKADKLSGQARITYLAKADLASAEAYFYEGQIGLAKQQAKRAQHGFVEGTPNWIQADDILRFEVPQTN
ncbi:M48 family metalloprotease [Methyloligella sp. 2.7D]|uniref:M48 family metalloprotease n=1 Tax=unclassified Methyloligella TaxID=2625955 RepID=UPI00157DB35E|nr:M48 family metalloprotease [Methyloligella sp. GL2]QKP77812.1 M48 family metallopeptidase [Methyloligella sp. GL2]